MLFAPDPGGPEADLPGADKAVHLLLFALLAATARWRFGPRPLVLGAVLAYAPASEAVQALLLSGRSGDLRDVVADVAGTLLGAWLTGRVPGRAAARS